MSTSKSTTDAGRFDRPKIHRDFPIARSADDLLEHPDMPVLTPAEQARWNAALPHRKSTFDRICQIWQALRTSLDLITMRHERDYLTLDRRDIEHFQLNPHCTSYRRRMTPDERKRHDLGAGEWILIVRRDLRHAFLPLDPTYWPDPDRIPIEVEAFTQAFVRAEWADVWQRMWLGRAYRGVNEVFA